MPPQDTDPIDGFEEALADLDFDRARSLAGQAGPERKEELFKIIRVRSAEAIDRAEKLAARIQFLARADHYEGLLALAADPATEPFLALLSTELRRGATLHLEGAVRRQKRFQAAAERHMKAAAEALVLLDTRRAQSELAKINPRWLTDSQRAELEGLRIQTDHADAERKELETRTTEVLRDYLPEPPVQPAPSARRKPRSCLSSVLKGALILTAVIVVLITR